MKLALLLVLLLCPPAAMAMDKPPHASAFFWLLVLIGVIAAAAYWLSPRLSGQSARAAYLLIFLLCVFGLVALVKPTGAVAGGLAFAAIVITVRLLSSFEAKK